MGATQLAGLPCSLLTKGSQSRAAGEEAHGSPTPLDLEMFSRKLLFCVALLSLSPVTASNSEGKFQAIFQRVNELSMKNNRGSMCMSTKLNGIAQELAYKFRSPRDEVPLSDSPGVLRRRDWMGLLVMYTLGARTIDDVSTNIDQYFEEGMFQQDASHFGIAHHNNVLTLLFGTVFSDSEPCASGTGIFHRPFNTTSFPLYPLCDLHLMLVNAYRRMHGVAPLCMSESLMKSSYYYSELMAEKDNMSHYLEDFAIRFKISGWTGNYYAENILKGPRYDLDTMVHWWYCSERHAEAMLNPMFTHFGSGIAQNSNGTIYFTEHFGRDDRGKETCIDGSLPTPQHTSADPPIPWSKAEAPSKKITRMQIGYTLPSSSQAVISSLTEGAKGIYAYLFGSTPATMPMTKSETPPALTLGTSLQKTTSAAPCMSGNAPPNASRGNFVTGEIAIQVLELLNRSFSKHGSPIVCLSESLSALAAPRVDEMNKTYKFIPNAPNPRTDSRWDGTIFVRDLFKCARIPMDDFINDLPRELGPDFFTQHFTHIGISGERNFWSIIGGKANSNSEPCMVGTNSAALTPSSSPTSQATTSVSTRGQKSGTPQATEAQDDEAKAKKIEEKAKTVETVAKIYNDAEATHGQSFADQVLKGLIDYGPVVAAITGIILALGTAIYFHRQILDTIKTSFERILTWVRGTKNNKRSSKVSGKEALSRLVFLSNVARKKSITSPALAKSGLFQSFKSKISLAAFSDQLKNYSILASLFALQTLLLTMRNKIHPEELIKVKNVYRLPSKTAVELAPALVGPRVKVHLLETFIRGAGAGGGTALYDAIRDASSNQPFDYQVQVALLFARRKKEYKLARHEKIPIAFKRTYQKLLRGLPSGTVPEELKKDRIDRGKVSSVKSISKEQLRMMDHFLREAQCYATPTMSALCKVATERFAAVLPKGLSWLKGSNSPRVAFLVSEWCDRRGRALDVDAFLQACEDDLALLAQGITELGLRGIETRTFEPIAPGAKWIKQLINIKSPKASACLDREGAKSQLLATSPQWIVAYKSLTEDQDKTQFVAAFIFWLTGTPVDALTPVIIDPQLELEDMTRLWLRLHCMVKRKEPYFI